MAARVFEKQADIELQREEWKEEVVKSKRRALEVTSNLLFALYKRVLIKGGRA